MKRRNKKLEEFEFRHMGLFQASEQEMDTAQARMRERLRLPLQFPAPEKRGNFFRPALAIGIVAAIALLMFVRLPQPIDAHAVVAEGSMLKVVKGKRNPVHPGDRIETGEPVRAEQANGSIALTDGSRLEMRAGTEVSLEKVKDGLSVHLSKGGVIVNAARQGAGHLYVQTKDVTVSVAGTVFLVNAGEEGSRVAVIEGEVHVQQGATSKKLLAGEQVATSPLLETWPVAEEISWSGHLEKHIALLQQSVSQTEQITPEAFEETSIRPNTSTSGAPAGGPRCPPFQIQIDPRHFIATNMSLYNLIALAYGKNCPAPGVLSGGPDWIRTDHFDIHALIPLDTPTYTPRQFREGEAPRLQMMLQSLLAKRFMVQLRRDTKEMPIYELSVVKEGRMKPAGDPSERKPQPIRQGMRGFNTPEISVSSFVGVLQGMVGRPVIDKTNLKGLFEVRLEYPIGVSAAPFGPDTPPSGADIPALLAILPDQLGLKLEPAKAPVEILVIERAEKPTDN